MGELRRRRWWRLAGIGVTLGVVGCGARTQLHDCLVEGETRPCTDECGQGEQSCHKGRWSTCDVPRTLRACGTPCGPGEQACQNGTWHECLPRVTERACTNECGEGIQECVDNAWGSCQVPIATRDCRTVCGDGKQQCEDGVWSACNGPQPRTPTLQATVRDFSATHEDFEPYPYDTHDEYIVESVLDADGKPIYANDSRSITTTSEENFDQWYRDVPGVNLSTTIEIPLIPSQSDPSVYVYDNQEFFPIDGRLFGNEGVGAGEWGYQDHNYHFTVEIHTRFLYSGGEVFSFRGDDDVWVFINGRLAIDLGGLHEALSDSVDLDESATELGISAGEVYGLALFFAERHTVSSSFHIETTINQFDFCD